MAPQSASGASPLEAERTDTMKEIRYPAVVTFRVDDGTKAVIDRVATARGVTPGILCRDIVMKDIGAVLELPRVRREVANRDQLRDLLGELGRQGSLLNQVARRLNIGAPLGAAAQDLAAMRAAYETALARVTIVLGVGREP